MSLVARLKERADAEEKRRDEFAAHGALGEANACFYAAFVLREEIAAIERGNADDARVIKNCGDCGWKEFYRDKHADTLDHFCGHPTLRVFREEERTERRRLHIVTGETYDLNEEMAWPEIPNFCPLTKAGV